MLRWADRQRQIAEALLAWKVPALQGPVTPNCALSVRGWAVHRNNLIVGLTTTLEEAFPAITRIVGAQFFGAMARAYIEREPPSSPILAQYGAGFPNFIASFDPAAALPYLPDVGRIEWAWSEAYNAAEASPLEVADFAGIKAVDFSGVRLALHPSVRLVRSRQPALTIWRMNVNDGVPHPVDLEAGGEDALVIRAGAHVEVRSVPPGGAEFVLSLAAGRSVAEATAISTGADSRFDLLGNLAALIDAGVFVGHSFVSRPHTSCLAQGLSEAACAAGL